MGTAAIIETLIQKLEAAESRGLSRYRLSQLAGIPQSTLSRLMSRERPSLKVETVERLCGVLGLELEIRPTKKGTRK
jgi:transcriptional regulator with XRE-family HTH domain